MEISYTMGGERYTTRTILVLEAKNYSKLALKLYGQAGNVHLWSGCLEDIDPDSVWVLVVRLGYFIGPDWLKAFPNLRYVVSPTTGLNHIDLACCSQRKVEVLSLKGETDFLERITSTAEHTLALILSVVRRIPAAHHSVVSEFRWDRDCFRGRQLSSLSLGIIGLGRIGRQIVTYAHALGMNVRAYDPHVGLDQFGACGLVPSSLDEVLQESDIVSLHADYRIESRHMIDRKAIWKMKPNAYLINTARGELLDEKAVVDALKAGRLGGVAVDVLEGEQFNRAFAQRPLVKYAREHNNVVLTPHIGGCTSDAMAMTEEYMAKRFLMHVGL